MPLKGYPIYAPLTSCITPVGRQLRKVLVFQTTTRITVSSYILFVPTQRHRKFTWGVRGGEGKKNKEKKNKSVVGHYALLLKLNPNNDHATYKKEQFLNA